jgi:hypothetical protein
MKNRIAIAQITLWFFVLSAGILTGGSIFEGVVLTPLWSHSLPESVRHWDHGTIQSKFFAFVTPCYALSVLAILLASRWMPAKQRRWALIAGLCGLIVVIATFTFFFPILQKTQGSQGTGLARLSQFSTFEAGRPFVFNKGTPNFGARQN